MHKGRQQSEGPSTQRMLFVTISVTLPMWASTLMKVKVRLTVGGRKHYSCVGNYAEFWPMTSHRCTWHRGTNRKPTGCGFTTYFKGEMYTQKRTNFHPYFGGSQHHLSRRSSTRTTVWTKWTPATPSARKTIWFERVVHVTNCDDSWVVLRKSLATVVIVVTWAPPSTWVDWFLKRSVHTYCYVYRSCLTLDRHWTYFQHRTSAWVSSRALSRRLIVCGDPHIFQYGFTCAWNK